MRHTSDFVHITPQRSIMRHDLLACSSRGLSYILINTHLAFLIGNSGIVSSACTTETGAESELYSRCALIDQHTESIFPK